MCLCYHHLYLACITSFKCTWKNLYFSLFCSTTYICICKHIYDGMCLFMACLVNNKYNNNVFGLNSIHSLVENLCVCIVEHGARTKGHFDEERGTIFGERWTRENTKTQNDTTIAHIHLTCTEIALTMSTIKL